jgi:hypothetical protein
MHPNTKEGVHMTLQPKKSSVYRDGGYWLRLKQLGYDVIWANGKAGPGFGWPTRANTPADIATWKGATAGVRTAGQPTLFIDLDVHIASAMAELLAEMAARWPDFMAKCLRRHSGKVSLCLIGLCPDTDRRVLRTRSFKLDPSNENEKKQRAEIYTGNVSHYFAVHGLHSSPPDRHYDYHGRSILDVPLRELPIFPAADLGKLIDLCEAVLARPQHGLTGLLGTRTEGLAAEVFDLLPEQVFKLKDGDTLTLAELAEDVRKAGKHEGFATIWDVSSNSPDRVKANWHGLYGLQLFDTHLDVKHYFAAAQPVDTEAFGAQLAAAIGATAEEPAPDKPAYDPAEAPRRPADTAGLALQTNWLLCTHAYCAPFDTVVELFEPSDACHLRPVAFQRLFRAWREESLGPRQGQRISYAYAAWEVAPRRVNVRGVRMHPGMAFPLYEEGGAFYKNTYRAPHHEGAGALGPWLAFIEHLLPEPVERHWFLDWLAHKLRHPEIPSISIIMVATDASGAPVYGCGRNTLCKIITHLLGPRYVRSLDFDVLAGRSAQGVYTDWMAYSVMVYVSEARDAEGGRWTSRNALYERLKELVDPTPQPRTFHVKGKQAFEGLSFTSYMIMSNNNDALKLPADDRRFTALRNGVRLEQPAAKLINHWMGEPGNIAELARALAARDLSGFNAYEPLHTATKTTMQELARTEFDDWFLDIRRRLGPHALFTGELIEQAIRLEAGSDHSHALRDRVTARVRTEAMGVPTLDRPRMPLNPLTGRRDWIMCWRGYDGPRIDTLELARALVERSRALLLGGDEGTDPAAGGASPGSRPN